MTIVGAIGQVDREKNDRDGDSRERITHMSNTLVSPIASAKWETAATATTPRIAWGAAAKAKGAQRAAPFVDFSTTIRFVAQVS